MLRQLKLECRVNNNHGFFENRGGFAQHATRATPTRSSHGPKEEDDDDEEEAIFIRDLITNENPPNSH